MLSFCQPPFPFAPFERRHGRVMAPGESIRRALASSEAAATGGEEGEERTNAAVATATTTMTQSSAPSLASRLVAPSSIASGFAKFTHKGEDTWSNSTGLRVDVPGKAVERKERRGLFFRSSSIFILLYLFHRNSQAQAPTGNRFWFLGRRIKTKARRLEEVASGLRDWKGFGKGEAK